MDTIHANDQPQFNPLELRTLLTQKQGPEEQRVASIVKHCLQSIDSAPQDDPIHRLRDHFPTDASQWLKGVFPRLNAIYYEFNNAKPVMRPYTDQHFLEEETADYTESSLLMNVLSVRRTFPYAREAVLASLAIRTMYFDASAALAQSEKEATIDKTEPHDIDARHSAA